LGNNTDYFVTVYGTRVVAGRARLRVVWPTIWRLQAMSEETGTGNRGLWITLAVLGGIAAVIYGGKYLSRKPPAPSQLADMALNSELPDQRQHAAVMLADSGPAGVPHIREVFRRSEASDVKVACIEGIAQNWDYDSMDLLLDALDDPSPVVRGRAASAVMRMVGRNRRFRAEGPEAERKMLAQYMREDWEAMRRHPRLEDLKQLMREGYDK
jgi:hypothetical protein